MRVAILGIDGYLGWPLALYLAERGFDVCGFDDLSRRRRVKERGSLSVVPIANPRTREQAFRDVYGGFSLETGWTLDKDFLRGFLDRHRPDAIVHFAEIPSAPYSMIDGDAAVEVMKNNVIGTMNVLYAMKEFCPQAHLVKLGTMGEYGTPDIDIPEGFFEIEYRGRKDRLPFPRQAGSWYHWTKVHDSNNVMYACKLWGLKSTDIMQGVVYGVNTPEMSGMGPFRTRFDIDEAFGTVVNRYVAQAVSGHPLTVYGDTGRQTRGFLPLQDSMQCITRIIENPPQYGQYRVVNQFEDTYSVLELAKRVKVAGEVLGLDNITIHHYRNPRVESHDHHYNPDHEILLDLGYEPTRDMGEVLKDMILTLDEHRARIVKRVLVPNIDWRAGEGVEVDVIE